MITAIYAGILGLLAVFLANQVLYVRLRPKEQPKWRADATFRVQSNFVENVPLALLLLFLAEYVGVQAQAIHGFGVSLVTLRILHAWGMSRTEGANYPRLIGAQGTFVLISILSATLIYHAL